MIKRGEKRQETALNDRNLPLKTSSSQLFYPLRVFGENSSYRCNLTGRLENVEMRRTDAQYAKSPISFQNSYSLSMLTSSNDTFATASFQDKKANKIRLVYEVFIERSFTQGRATLLKSKRLFKTVMKSVINSSNRGDIIKNFKVTNKMIYKQGYRGNVG